MDLSWLLTVLLSTVVLYLVYVSATKNSRYWESRGIANVYSLPFFGVMFDTVTMRKSFTDIVIDIYHKLDGKPFGGFFQFTKPVLMIRDPELITQIFVKDFVHFEDRTASFSETSDLFSLGLANLSGDKWRTARHKLTPTFTSGKLKMMFDPIDKCTDKVVSYLNNNLKEDISAKELSLKHIINAIACVAFGLEIDTIKDSKNNEFYRASSKFFQPTKSFILKIRIAVCFPKIRNFLNIKIIDEHVERFFQKLATDVIKYRESTGTRRNDFLQLMLDQRERERKLLSNMSNSNVIKTTDELEDPDDKELLDQLRNTPVRSDNRENSTEIFTDEFIAAQTFLFISGGSETTATVLSFILYDLAVNKKCQKRLQQEIDDVLYKNEFNYQAIKKMTYMDQIINETMRCHPIGGVMTRVCTKDYKIPKTDIIIEKGTFIWAPVSGLHNDRQYFDDPETYNPDRFEDIDSIPKGVFFNFGYGPRMCIAMRLAILVMKIYLAKLLLNFDIELSSRTKLPLKLVKSAIISAVEGGLWVKFEKRQTQHT